MSTTAKRATGVLIALLLGAIGSLARADWLTCGGNFERTGFTAQGVLPPISVAWKYASDPGNTYQVNPVIVGQMVYWVTVTNQWMPKPSWWPSTSAWPPPASMQKPSWWPAAMDWPPIEGVGSIVAISADTGVPSWQFRVTGGAGGRRIRSSPAYADGTLYFGADNGLLYALDAESGEIKWYFKTPAAVRSAPAVLEGVVYFGSNDAKVYAVDALTGKQKWTFQAGDDVYAPIAATRDMIWAACTDGTLYAVDAQRGIERWRIPFVGSGGLYLAPAVEARRAYLPVKDRIYRVSASGAVSAFADALSARISAPPALGRNYLYVGCQDGTLYALDLTRGRARWTYKFRGAVQAQPLVAGNLVIAGGSLGEVAALDAETGALRWTYGEQAPYAPARNVSYALMAAAASGGDLYLSWDDGILARFTPDALDFIPPEITRRTPEPGSPADPVSPTSTVVIGANVYDEGSGVAPKDVTLTLDGKPLELKRRPDGDYYVELRGTKAAPALENGWHTVVVTAQDQRGNKATETWTFLVHLETAEEARPEEPGAVGATERF